MTSAARNGSRRRASSVPAKAAGARKKAVTALRPRAQARPARASENAYRDKWKWDSVGWGSHGMGCYPGNCPYRVYVRDGKVFFEEQAGTFPIIEKGVPDMNPTGCQKGCSWKEFLYGEERLHYPLKRVGKRGSGKWERVSWDQAWTEVADAIIDALQEVGPESIISPGPSASTRPNRGRQELLGQLGALITDIDGEVNDDFMGVFLTFGKIFSVSSMDDWFHPELHFIWHLNPSYTRIPYAHYITEARYKGSEVISVAPDLNPSAIHADRFVALKPGSDAAFALGMCSVIVKERIYDEKFVKEQTDLPFLVRLDNRRYLRASDVVEDGRNDRFYIYDAKTRKIVDPPLGTLKLGKLDPALEGTFPATLKDGKQVKVTPVFELVKKRLQDYTPEKAEALCGVHPDVMKSIARKIATKSTLFNTGYNVSKYYHGDLMERSMCLLLGLTGNWGKKGTGLRTWGVPSGSSQLFSALKTKPGTEEIPGILQMRRGMLDAVKAQDPSITDEIVMLDLFSPGNKLAAPPSEGAAAGGGMGRTVPTFFMWYHHFGFRDIWNKKEWSDPSMKRPFDEYAKEAMDNDWWRAIDFPRKNQPPRIWFEVTNSFRRLRGGSKIYLENLLPQLKMIVTFDYRMSTTCLYSDIVLPVASQHEKQKGVLCLDPGWFVLDDKVVEPASPEIKDEWQACLGLAKKIEERAKARGFVEFKDGLGRPLRLDNIVNAMTRNGVITDLDEALDDSIRDGAAGGEMPPGTTLESMRKNGPVRLQRSGLDPLAMANATDIESDQTFSPWTRHIKDKWPYPTLTRRAQFYIDHDWFFEAGEELPMHKEPPKMGGNYPFMVTGGHGRWSKWSVNTASKIMLETHRGEPHVVMNNGDAAARGIKDNEKIRLYNDHGSSVIPAKLSPSVRPGQLIVYNGWDPYQFKDWKGCNEYEPGMVKWLHLAGGYGHLRYFYGNWLPVPMDRATRVDVAKVG